MPTPDHFSVPRPAVCPTGYSPRAGLDFAPFTRSRHSRCGRFASRARGRWTRSEKCTGIAVGTVFEVSLEDWFQHEFGSGLDYPITDRRNAERSLASIRFRYHYLPHRVRPIRLRDQLLAQARQPPIEESAPEVGVLSSTGITRLQESYDPVRLPPGPPSVATSRPLPSPVTRLPRLPEPPFRRAVLISSAHRAGSDCFPRSCSLPQMA
jgi:hypothetical protein